MGSIAAFDWLQRLTRNVLVLEHTTAMFQDRAKVQIRQRRNLALEDNIGRVGSS